MSSRKKEHVGASPSKAPENWTSRDQGQIYDEDLAQGPCRAVSARSALPPGAIRELRAAAVRSPASVMLAAPVCWS